MIPLWRFIDARLNNLYARDAAISSEQAGKIAGVLGRYLSVHTERPLPDGVVERIRDEYDGDPGMVVEALINM